MKKLVIVLLSLLMVFALAGCSDKGGSDEPIGTDEPENKLPVIYYVCPRAGGLAWNQSKIGFEQACEDLGVEGYFLAPAEPFNTAQCVDLANTAITSGAEILICAPQDYDLWGATIEECHSKGIAVGTIATPVEYADFNIGTTVENTAVEYLAQLEKLVDPNEELHILYLATVASQMTEIIRDAISDWCAKRGNAELVNTDLVQGDPALGNDKMSSNIAAYPNINVAIVTDAGGAVGAGSYVHENNRQDLVIVTGGNTGDILRYILEGDLDVSINWEYYDMGYQAVQMAVDFYQGKPVEKFVSPDPSIITAENVEAYAKQYGIDMGN